MKTIQLTEAAVAHVKNYLVKEGVTKGQPHYLRISTKVAGCNGLQYVYDMVEGPQPEDEKFSQGDFCFFVEKKSLPFIQGAVFDYVETGFQKGWKVKNPQETGSCGCGESFTV